MLNTAFKPAKDAIDPAPHLFPTHFTLDNFKRALQIGDFWGSIGRSLTVSLVVVLIGIAVGLLAALAISRFAFRGRKIVIVGILAVQMVPLVAMIIPVFLLLNDLGQYDRLSGLIITYLTFILPFTVWTLRGFIVNVPKELEEAAMVDGCSRTGAFIRVVFPLLAPGMVATSVYGFIQAWNEYLYALMLMSQNHQTATVWLSNFTTQHGTEYAPMMAGSTMMAVPIVVLFLLVQRKMAAGLTAGAVKG
jgi:N,N'-diacetylchitobiose transport system permease protein